MRLPLCLLLLALCGCDDSAPSANPIEPARGSAEVRIANAEWVAKEAQAAADQALASKSVSEARATQEKIALASANYWERCVDINNQFVANKADLWFKNFRPEAIEVTCRTAATKLRALQTTSVAPEIVDHVSRVIRGFETIGAIAKVKGRESLLRDAGDTLKFIYATSKGSTVGAVADGGWIEMGLGMFTGGRQATTEGLEHTTRIASDLIASEAAVIQTMRAKYAVVLQPW